MTRSARIDAPGVLHHVIIRGIEKRKIFRKDSDQYDFIDRLEQLVPATRTVCYAWALMRNHAHFLFRSGPAGMAKLMRRLLTGYAISFNRRYKRHGQLFQNRYKSIICQEDTYLKELVRYIHLNPVRAGLVKDLSGLKKYAFCGHGVVMGTRSCGWQDDQYVLRYFAQTTVQARKRYLAYVKAGLNQGRRPELVGGGLVRSLGGWAAVKKLRKQGMDRTKADQRILGEPDFVLSILEQADQPLERSYALKSQGVDLDTAAQKAARIFDIDVDEIFMKSRIQRRADARGLYCYWAVSELGHSLSDLARQLKMTPAGVGYAVQRGETIAREHGYELLGSVNE
jgi:putative transposase